MQSVTLLLEGREVFMSDVSQGDGWWEARDGKWYPPERHPDYKAHAQVAAPIMQTPQPTLTGSDATHQEPLESRQAAPSAFSAPHPAGGPLQGSEQGRNPVRPNRIEDRLALRNGALVGLALATASWVLIPGLQYLSNRSEGDAYFGYNLGFFILSNAFVGPVLAAPFVIIGLCFAALIAGWLVARAATNSRAGLSAGAASGSVFIASLVIPLLALIFVRLGISALVTTSSFVGVVQILVYAGLYAVLVLPFGIIGWLIGRPRQLSTERSELSLPPEANGPLPSSVKGWKPVRRKRIDDRLALRRGALLGLSVATTAWFLIAGLQRIHHQNVNNGFTPNYLFFLMRNSYTYYDYPNFLDLTETSKYRGAISFYGPNITRFDDLSNVPPFVAIGLFVAALLAGWLVARASTNSRAGLSAAAASGSIFLVSLAIPLATLLFAFPAVLRYQDARYFNFVDVLGTTIGIAAFAAFFAVLALPFGIIGWLIGRPRPLSVAATASINLNQTAASDELMLVLSGLRNQRVERPTISTVSLRLKFFPGWAILLSLLFFPLGVLAAIAAQREETGTIILNDTGQDTSTLQVRGLFDEAACTRIEAFLKQHAASKELS
jgi:hypothetical protein